MTINRFLETYSRLLVSELQHRLGKIENAVELTDADARFLMQVASALAFGPIDPDESTEAMWKTWAYDVATRLAVMRASSDVRFRKAGEMILARLGNFPGQQYLHEQYAQNGQDDRLPPVLAAEALTHEAENTVEFLGLGQRTLTDFQLRLVESLRTGLPVSVSAPTSAGKSYVLTLEIVSAMAGGAVKVVVYIVPTRALIRQVMHDLLDRLRDAGLSDVAVLSAPAPVEEDQVSKGVVYVLTQERLLSLLYSPEGRVPIDRVYVDEAQEIGDEDRGMILHSAVQELIRRFPSARVCFASPLTANPEFLFDEFGVNVAASAPFVERKAPVSQTVIILDKIKGKSSVVDVRARTPAGDRDVARLDVGFSFTGVVERLAQTTRYFTGSDETSIIYANRASDAIDIAVRLAVLIDEQTDDPEVLDLIDFVRTHVHSRYALVDTLPKGVAFHYGKMPHIIRSQVEDLLRRRKIRFVASTSTLLQGINLPAKNIFILAPRKGNDNPMKGPDFWNLAGRAGRLRETFSGNIWCLAPSEWKVNPLEGEQLSKMTSSFRGALEDQQVTEGVVAVIDDHSQLSQIGERNRVEQVFGKVFSEFTCQQLEVANSPFAQEADRARMSQIDNKCRGVLDTIQVPIEVCKRNSVISPLSLDLLWRRFGQEPIEGFIPFDPRRDGALYRMRDIFQVINEVFIGANNNSWSYFATLAYWWVSGQSLKDLIANYIKHYKIPPDNKKINEAIRKFLEALEQDVRFKYVKYLKAYIDTLTEYLTVVRREDLKKSIAPLHLYIEYGARDRVLVMLMSLGLSRTTAIFIRNAITREPEIERRECWQRLQQLRVRLLDIPNVCKGEIRKLTGQPNQ